MICSSLLVFVYGTFGSKSVYLCTEIINHNLGGGFCCIYRRNVIIYQYRIPLYYGGRKMSKRTLEELVFHDDFMFAAVMMDAENCRCFLERVLEIRIEKWHTAFSLL